jgi:hypothetical protein
MCYFTRVYYAVCKCRYLLTGPNDTLLCPAAGTFSIVQGLEQAPVFCHPLPEGEEDRFANKASEYDRVIYGHCEQCRPAAVEELEPLKREILLCREEEKEHKTTAVAGTYDESEANELVILRQSIEQTTHEVMEIAQDAEKVFAAHPSLIDSIPNEDIRLLLLQPGTTKYDTMFGQALQDCNDWLRPLQVYIDQCVPRNMFADLMRFVNMKVEQAALRSRQLYTIVRYFKEDMGSGSHIVAIEDVIEQLFNALKEARMGPTQGLVDGDGDVINFDKERADETWAHLDPMMSTDAIPDGLLEKEAEIMAVHQAFTAQYVPAPQNDRGSIFNRRAFQTSKYDKPLGMSDAVTSKKLQSVIAQRNLIVIIPQEVGDDEPAKECEVEHIQFLVDEIVERPIRPEELVPKKRFGRREEPYSCALDGDAHESQSVIPSEITAEQIGITYGLPDSDTEEEEDEHSGDTDMDDVEHEVSAATPQTSTLAIRTLEAVAHKLQSTTDLKYQRNAVTQPKRRHQHPIGAEDLHTSPGKSTPKPTIQPLDEPVAI